MTEARISDVVEAAFLKACLTELRSPKPGNVHDYAAGHRMTVRDFEASAEAAAPHIARSGAPVGSRVRSATEATVAAVGCNTNLGILLLAAPIAVAFEAAAGREPDMVFQSRLADVVATAGIDDAVEVFEAIRLASPGGLGSTPEHDVSGPATVPLAAAMSAAADRDRIARQYVTKFTDVFEIGLPARRAGMLTHADPAWATLAVYFAFASAFPDTHVERKHGRVRAEMVRRLFVEYRGIAGPEHLPELLAFDRRLKSEGINPGTSADLTVATEFLALLLPAM